MDWRQMPPLAALRAFSAFAEHGNLTASGAALNVSHAAISQHLRSLEQHLGVSLLDRSGRALELTEEGQRLADSLALGFGAIFATVQDLTGADAARPLHVSVTPAFAANWLMPRLPDFRALHPEINLMLDPSAGLVELKPGGVDVALRYGLGPWAGVECESLFQSPIVVVAAPELLGGRVALEPSDLAQMPWLEELGTSEARNWIRKLGVREGIVGQRTEMPGNLVLSEARDGQGVAVTVRAFVEADVAAGRLVILFEEDGDAGYHIVTKQGVLRPSARKFRSWLRRQKMPTD